MVKRVTIDRVAVLNGEELVRTYGPEVGQQLVDMIVAAVQRGDDAEAQAIDGRLREVTNFVFTDPGYHKRPNGATAPRFHK